MLSTGSTFRIHTRSFQSSSIHLLEKLQRHFSHDVVVTIIRFVRRDEARRLVRGQLVHETRVRHLGRREQLLPHQCVPKNPARRSLSNQSGGLIEQVRVVVRVAECEQRLEIQRPSKHNRSHQRPESDATVVSSTTNNFLLANFQPIQIPRCRNVVCV